MTHDELAVQKRIAEALERLAKTDEGREQTATRTAELVLQLAERFLEGKGDAPLTMEDRARRDVPMPIDAKDAVDPPYGLILFQTHMQLRAYITAVEVLLAHYATTHKPEANTCMVVAEEILHRFRACEYGSTLFAPSGSGSVAK